MMISHAVRTLAPVATALALSACEMAGIAFNTRKAHSASYDCSKTAELFCAVVNRWKDTGGWPPVIEGS